MRKVLCTAAVLLSALAGAASAVPPTPTRWVTDEASFLSPGTRASLDAELADFERRTGHQVLVYVGRTTGGVPIEDYAVRAFEAWKVGRKGIDDGLVLFVMADDRAMRIEVGYGLEDQVTDAKASRIISEVLAPGFRSGDRDAAMTRAVDALLTTVQGGSLPAPTQPRVELPSTGQLVIFAILALLFAVLFVTNPGLAISLLFLMGRRHGGGGGFRGGGGRSGGGGASGSW